MIRDLLEIVPSRPALVWHYTVASLCGDTEIPSDFLTSGRILVAHCMIVDYIRDSEGNQSPNTFIDQCLFEIECQRDGLMLWV